MGSPCLCTRQQAPKMEYFYWLRVKSSNHLHTALSRGYLKDTEFFSKLKACFIHTNSIASFKLFLIVWLREYCTFSDNSVVSLISSPCPKYTQYRTILQKQKHVLLSDFYPSSNIFFIRLFLKQIPEKNRGSPCSLERKGELISLSSLV